MLDLEALRPFLIFSPILIPIGILGLKWLREHVAINKFKSGKPMNVKDARTLNSLHNRTGQTFIYDGDPRGGR